MKSEINPYYFTLSNLDIKNDGVYKNPGTLAQKALNLCNNYVLHKSEKLRALFMRNIDLLIEKIVYKKGFGIWPYNYISQRAKIYGCRIPWVSALAQGFGISALVRAYTLTGNMKYLEISRHALGAFKVPMKKGGVLYIDENDGDYWYEEYACPYCIPSGVLNGFIISLLGIYDLHRITNEEESQQLFDRGIQTLNHHISDFDTNYPFKLSYYDRLEHIGTPKYHLLHIKLLEILHKITKQSIFRIYRQKWEEYRKQWYAHQSYRWLGKVYYVKSGYNLKDSIKLGARLIFKEKKFISHRKNRPPTILTGMINLN